LARYSISWDNFSSCCGLALVRIFAFVIMPDHFHTVWKTNESMEKSDFSEKHFKIYRANNIKGYETRRNRNSQIIVRLSKRQILSVKPDKRFDNYWNRNK
jgi:REP element-mobilizing transposase RayT